MSFPRYPKYKASGVEWLGEVPQHWEVKVLKRIVSTPITDGPHETPDFPDEGIPFVSAEAVATGTIDFTKIRGFISAADHQRYSEKYRPRIGDVYMVKSGATTGVTAIVETDIEFNIWSPLAAIRCGGQALPRFVLNFLRSRNFQEGVTLNWSFGTQQNIGMRVIENLAVSLPPVAEQTKIAEFLDRETSKIDGLVGEQRRLMELLKEKRQAVISHAVTKGLNPHAPLKPSGIEWLGEIPEHWRLAAVRFRYTVQLGKMLDTEKITGKHLQPYLRVFDVQWGAINVEELPQMDFDPSVRDRFRLTPGDLLINEGGSYPGRSAIWNGELEECYFQKALHRLRPCDATTDTTRFFFYIMAWATARGVFTAGGNESTIEHLPAEKFRKYRFAFPPMSEQLAIADFLDQELGRFDALTAEAERGIELLQERRTALISAAVTGQIDVRGLAETGEA